MNTSDFDELMQRYVACDVSDTEKKKVDAWLALVKVEYDSHLHLSEADEEIVLQRIRGTLDSMDAGNVFHSVKSCLLRFVSRTWMKIVASVIVRDVVDSLEKSKPH